MSRHPDNAWNLSRRCYQVVLSPDRGLPCVSRYRAVWGSLRRVGRSSVRDRTYYTDEAGNKVGWRDNVTGEITGERPGGKEEIESWLGVGREGLVGEAHTPEEMPDQNEKPAASRVEPDVDLSLNRPGQAARERADEEYEQRKAELGRFRAWAGKKLDWHTDERAWRIGADAEETVGAELEKLTRHGWYVLHSVPVGEKGSDIDHVLIGPGGVITVNSKHHPDAKVWVVSKQVRVNNAAVPYLRNSRFEAERASRLLTAAAGFPVHAMGCLVFRLREGSLKVKEEPGDVLVYRATEAYPALLGWTGVLEPDQVETIYEAARRRSTWVGGS